MLIPQKIMFLYFLWNNIINFYITHFLDYQGWIEKGWAYRAPADMYTKKIKENETRTK